MSLAAGTCSATSVMKGSEVPEANSTLVPTDNVSERGVSTLVKGGQLLSKTFVFTDVVSLGAPAIRSAVEVLQSRRESVSKIK